VDFPKRKPKNALIDLKVYRVENVLAAQRADCTKVGGEDFIPEEKGHHYASELVGGIKAK